MAFDPRTIWNGPASLGPVLLAFVVLAGLAIVSSRLRRPDSPVGSFAGAALFAVVLALSLWSSLNIRRWGIRSDQVTLTSFDTSTTVALLIGLNLFVVMSAWVAYPRRRSEVE